MAHSASSADVFHNIESIKATGNVNARIDEYGRIRGYFNARKDGHTLHLTGSRSVVVNAVGDMTVIGGGNVVVLGKKSLTINRSTCDSLQVSSMTPQISETRRLATGVRFNAVETSGNASLTIDDHRFLGDVLRVTTSGNSRVQLARKRYSKLTAAATGNSTVTSSKACVDHFNVTVSGNATVSGFKVRTFDLMNKSGNARLFVQKWDDVSAN